MYVLHPPLPLTTQESACRSGVESEFPDGQCDGAGEAPLLGCCPGLAHTPQGTCHPHLQYAV